ncbi:hypothetical protein [Methylobacterium sp. ARG-1]|uniref:hypothetical protein n=1 Tax=Methylobacterium sp. ARG-1 TaxID=1692501 RepID=UPI0006813045|nr:hypothetical protein [Methylobacterium sp. ARG-1]KNY21729.1 hypothetical protein AKJ13_15985 [Methylobacterium sp. ARG-1]
MSPLLGLALAGALVGGADVLRSAPPVDSERERHREQERSRREKRAHQDRAWERRQRRQREDEMRERLLRQSIAAGRDDRADKYLHSAARRRRDAERASRPLIAE